MFDDDPYGGFARFRKPLFWGIGVAVFAYLFLLPVLAWQPPAATANLPASWPANQNLTFTIQLTAWHANFQVTKVRFYTDYHRSTAHGQEGLFYPTPLLEDTPVTMGGLFNTNRLTYPRHRSVEVTVPFSGFAAAGKLGPGTLAGKLDLSYLYYKPMLDRRYGDNRVRQGRSSVPFEITITAP